MSSALFIDLEADFHARVPVVICKEKSRWIFLTITGSLDFSCKMYKSNSKVMLFEIFMMIINNTTQKCFSHTSTRATNREWKVKLLFFSTVASSAKSVQGMKTRSRPRPIFLLYPGASHSSSPLFWASDDGLRYDPSWEPDMLLTLARQLSKGANYTYIFLCVKYPFFNFERVVPAFCLDLCDRSCRGRWATTIRLCPHGYLLLTAAQRAHLACLPEARGVCFFPFFAWNRIYSINFSIGWLMWIESNHLIVFRLRCFHSAGCQTSISRM